MSNYSLLKTLPGVLPSPTSELAPVFQPGDLVWIKRIPAQISEHGWKGPYPVTLTISTAVKVAGVVPWIHDFQLKKMSKNN